MSPVEETGGGENAEVAGSYPVELNLSCIRRNACHTHFAVDQKRQTPTGLCVVKKSRARWNLDQREALKLLVEEWTWDAAKRGVRGDQRLAEWQ